MNRLLKNLNPIEHKKYTIIANELDEFNEITFCQTGSVLVGYELNHKRRYCLKLYNYFILGAYFLTFNKKSNYIYRANSNVTGFFIRKR